MKANHTIIAISILLTACTSSIKTADRPELGQSDTVEVTREGDIKKYSASMTDNDFKKYAYELGFDPEKGLTEEQKNEVTLRYKVRSLERSLDSNKERIQYSKIVPYLKTDKEKYEFLSIPTIEGRQVYANKNKIMSRAKNNSRDYLEAVESQDLVLGMTQDLVKKSWGDPDSIEVSGNSIYKNEKWRYIRDVPTAQGYKRERRYVFFEGGRVVGWETE